MKTTIDRRLGRCPSKKEVSLKLANYVDIQFVLPKIPPDFGHEMVVPAGGWGMDLNDQLGDCVIAGAYHEHKLWAAVQKRAFDYTDAQVLHTYEKIAGYDPKDPSTDNGTDMQAAASHRRKHGIPDRHRRVHKIDAYIALEPGNWEEQRVAMYLFGAGAIGMRFFDFNWDQYRAGKPWDWQSGGKSDGGHYIPGIGERGGVISVVTWGSLRGMTRTCYSKQVDEAIAYFSKEYLDAKGKSPEGFDQKALLADLAHVTKATS